MGKICSSQAKQAVLTLVFTAAIRCPPERAQYNKNNVPEVRDVLLMSRLKLNSSCDVVVVVRSVYYFSFLVNVTMIIAVDDSLFSVYVYSYGAKKVRDA